MTTKKTFWVLCLCLMSAMASIGWAVPPGLVGWWSFDEGAGDVAGDGSGNGNDGALVNTAWAAGYLGSALDFDGTAYVDVPVESWSTIDMQVTLAFWVYIDAATLPQNNFIFGAFHDPANNETRAMSSHLPWGNGNVYFDTGGGPGGGYDRISQAFTNDDVTGVWIHWAWIKNAETGDQILYRNGVAWLSGTGLTRPLDGAGVTRFTIGTKPSLVEGWFTGIIDDVQLYNVALTPE